MYPSSPSPFNHEVVGHRRCSWIARDLCTSSEAANASLGSGDQNAANQVRVMQHDSVDRQLARLTQRAQGGECACWINSCTSRRKGREQQAALACDQCKFNLNATQQDSVLKRSSNLQFVRSHDSLEVMVS